MTKAMNLLGTGLVIGSFVVATLWVPLVLVYPPLYTPGHDVTDCIALIVLMLFIISITGLAIRMANDA
jgi:hypothetical protein